MLMTVADYMNLPIVSANHRLFYGSDINQFGDLYLPSSRKPHPVVVLLHGGCWLAEYGLEPLGKMCQAIADMGCAVWSLEYRRIGNGGGWKTTFTDVAIGADYLKNIADQYTLDLSRVVVVGHSAGGHLGLWLAGRHCLPTDSELFSDEPLPIHGVVALAAIPDLIEGIKRNICFGACQNLIGDTPEAAPQRYQHGSPHLLLPLGVYQWHIVGRSDELVPADYVQQYITVANQHDQVKLEIIAETGHFEVVVPGTPAWNAVKNAILTLSSDQQPVLAVEENKG